MKKFAIILAVVAGSVSASFAGSCGACNKCANHYYPGQTFTTGCAKACKPACKPACRPAPRPVCRPACNPCR